MAEFQKVMRELKRFCAKHDCVNCPIGEGIRNNRESSCSPWVTNHPEEAEPIVMQWAAEHPIVTNGMKFEEIFGFTLHHKFCVSGDAVDWLNEEYKEEQNDGKN